MNLENVTDGTKSVNKETSWCCVTHVNVKTDAQKWLGKRNKKKDCVHGSGFRGQKGITGQRQTDSSDRGQNGSRSVELHDQRMNSTKKSNKETERVPSMILWAIHNTPFVKKTSCEWFELCENELIEKKRLCDGRQIARKAVNDRWLNEELKIHDVWIVQENDTENVKVTWKSFSWKTENSGKKCFKLKVSKKR